MLSVTMSLWLWSVVLVACSTPTDAIVGGEEATAPEPDAAVVFVQRNELSARLEGFKDDKRGYYSFLGIRYAEPPVGPRRFQRPVRQYLGGEINVTKPCMPCPQRHPYESNRVIGHEDCLCLNVYSPKMPESEEGSPVVFFIHGGNYRSGSIAPYGGQHLAKKDTILVTAQYRLGSLGYLSTGDVDASGNFGLFDLYAAYLWVQDYIQFFGGDPKRVSVMGQGSGGSAASLLAMSPESEGVMAVTALSGAPLSPGAVRPDPARHARTISQRTGCPLERVESFLICLRKLPMEKIVLADQDLDMAETMDTIQFIDDISGRSGAGARVEGKHDLRALPPLVWEEPAESLKKEDKRPPLLTGVTSAETARAVFGTYEKFLASKLQTVQDFIKNDLIGGLQGVVQGVEGLLPVAAVQSFLPINLSDFYSAAFNAALNTTSGLFEIAQATGDALFNFPAYQSVKAWSTRGSAFLYSFEHVGNLSKGSHFLPGLALTEGYGNSSEISQMKGPSHGDELAYIFEPLDSEGKSVGGEVSSTDAKVRESFVSLISDFAHNTNKKEKKKGSSIFEFETFSQDTDHYLQIKDKISVKDGFRFCEMGLWGGMTNRLTGGFCKQVFDQLNNLLKIGNKIPIPLDPIGTVGGILSNPSNDNKVNPAGFPLSNLPGASSGLFNNFVSQSPNVYQQTTKKNQNSLPFFKF